MKDLLEKLVREAEAEGPQGDAAIAFHKKPKDIASKMISQGLTLVFEEPEDDVPAAPPMKEEQEVDASPNPAAPDESMYATPKPGKKTAFPMNANDVAFDPVFATPVAQTQCMWLLPRPRKTCSFLRRQRQSRMRALTKARLPSLHFPRWRRWWQRSLSSSSKL
jgi:hypothetical protein